MKQKFEILQSIAHHLMLHGSFINNIGLLEGKMGIAIFFYHYYNHTKKALFRDFGGELIDEIYDEVHINSPLDFINGLSGIAWGIEYLIRNKYVDADPDEILEDLDNKILEWDVRRIMDISLENGLIGLAYYIINRCSNKDKRCQSIPEIYISDLVSSLKLKIGNNNLYYHVIEDLTAIISGRKIVKIVNPLYEFYKNSIYKENCLFQTDYPLGISDNGLVGIGLNILEKDEKENIYY